MGVDVSQMSDEEGARACIDRIKELSISVGIPTGLSTLGVKKEDFTTLATNALKDACAATNPVTGSLEDLIQIFENAY